MGSSQIELRTGRLFEARFVGALTLEQVQQVVLRTRSLLGAHPGRVVGCTDLRHNRPVDPAVSDLFVAMLKTDNPKVERSAFLLSEESALAVLQAERMLREAGNPARRSFRNAEQLLLWLSEVLTPAEQTRARAFLDEGL